MNINPIVSVSDMQICMPFVTSYFVGTPDTSRGRTSDFLVLLLLIYAFKLP